MRPELNGSVEFDKVEAKHGRGMRKSFLSEALRADPNVLVELSHVVGKTHPFKAKETVPPRMQEPKAHQVVYYLDFGLEDRQRVHFIIKT